MRAYAVHTKIEDYIELHTCTHAPALHSGTVAFLTPKCDSFLLYASDVLLNQLEYSTSF